jgi:hypothetical protein
VLIFPRNLAKEKVMLLEEPFWMVEDAVMEEPSDLMMLPEFRQRVDREHHDEDLGLRSLLERPEVLRDIASWRR